MTEDPDVAIDDYLDLVRSHLPNEIADEIIQEIRTYLVEMAQELGHGQASIESVRRSIARFGAPSEIAQEYSKSNLDVEGYAHDDEREYEESSRESVQVVIERFPRVILTTFGLFLTWLVLFALMVVLVAYSLAPPHVFYLETVIDCIILASIFSVFILVYFLYRLVLARIIGGSSVFGERSEIEIVIDFIASFIAMLFVSGGLALHSLYWDKYGADSAGLMQRLLGFASFAMVIFILIRLFGDLLSLARPKDRVRAIKILASSGFAVSLGFAVVIGASIPIVGPHLLLWSDYTLLVFIAFFLAFQASTSLIKLVEIHRETSTSGQAFTHHRERRGGS
ncbi:MAG: hypothetical protein RTU09_05930 [Candidatus Thorarchaeota archaeon]